MMRAILPELLIIPNISILSWDTLPESLRDTLPKHRQDVIDGVSSVEFDFTTISV
jgi:hypothetical protein